MTKRQTGSSRRFGPTKPRGKQTGGASAAAKRFANTRRFSAAPRSAGDTAKYSKKPAREPEGIIERDMSEAVDTKPGPFRVVIAVHRPRFRGRAQRAAALSGWNVTALLNKQDPVGLAAKGPRPPDLLVLSGDFGRQKDLAIFRAVQPYRAKGMVIVGLVDDCHTAPEGRPDSLPTELCDICLMPPYKTAELRALYMQIYTEIRGEAAPPPIGRPAETEGEVDWEEDD